MILNVDFALKLGIYRPLKSFFYVSNQFLRICPQHCLLTLTTFLHSRSVHLSVNSSDPPCKDVYFQLRFVYIFHEIVVVNRIFSSFHGGLLEIYLIVNLKPLLPVTNVEPRKMITRILCVKNIFVNNKRSSSRLCRVSNPEKTYL